MKVSSQLIDVSGITLSQPDTKTWQCDFEN